LRTDIKLPINRKSLSQWLSMERMESDGYHHLFLRQKDARKWEALLPQLVKYFEKAHHDARVHFHRMAGISLEPCQSKTVTVQYPNSLPAKAKRGLFGEVICGLITECYRFVGDHQWRIPVFLFRYHQDAENYINRLARGGKLREVIGRLGDDFLALALKDDGTIEAILVGEAKFRTRLRPSEGDELVENVHKNLSNDNDVPVNIMRVCELLKQKDPDNYAVTRADLERINLLGSQEDVPRLDLVCLIVQRTKRDYPPTYIPQDSCHPGYTCGRDLQAIEIVIDGACDLVDELYGRLYVNGGK